MDFVLEVVIPALLAVTVVFAVVMGSFFYLDSVGCQQLADINPDYSFQYQIPSGCKMKTKDGLYIHIHNIQYINGQITTP